MNTRPIEVDPSKMAAIELGIKTAFTQHSLTRELIGHASVEVVSDMIVQEAIVCLQIRFRVPGIDVPPVEVARYPKNGWHYLLRLLRLPYKNRIVTVNDTIVLPKIYIDHKPLIAYGSRVDREYRTKDEE